MSPTTRSRVAELLGPGRLYEAIERANALIAPAKLGQPQRLEANRQLFFPGRWGTFDFNVLVTEDLVGDLARKYGPGAIDYLVQLLVGHTRDAIENALKALVEQRAEALVDVRIAAHVRALHDPELVLRQAELEALVQQLVQRELNRPLARLWRALVAIVQRLRR